MWGPNNFHPHASSSDGEGLIRSRSVCVRFLLNKCPYSALACPYSHNKDDAMLCEAWKKGLCPHNRCLRRHYYLEEDRAPQRRELLREISTESSNTEFSSPLVVKVKTLTEKHRREEVDLETGRRRSWIETENKELIDITGEASPVVPPKKSLFSLFFAGWGAQKKIAEEDMKKKMAEEEALKKKMAEEEALKKKMAEEEALKKKMAEEEALKKKMAEEEDVNKKIAEEEALKKKMAKEEALKKRLSEEEARKKKVAEEEEAQKKREMEIRERERGENSQGSSNKCTNCGREFKGERGLRSHLNHPRSKCGKSAANSRQGIKFYFQKNMSASANSGRDEVSPASNVNLDVTVHVISDDES